MSKNTNTKDHPARKRYREAKRWIENKAKRAIRHFKKTGEK